MEDNLDWLLSEYGAPSCDDTVEEKIRAIAQYDGGIAEAERQCNCEFLFKSYEGIKREDIPRNGNHIAISIQEYPEDTSKELARTAVWLVRINA